MPYGTSNNTTSEDNEWSSIACRVLCSRKEPIYLIVVLSHELHSGAVSVVIINVSHNQTPWRNQEELHTSVICHWDSQPNLWWWLAVDFHRISASWNHVRCLSGLFGGWNGTTLYCYGWYALMFSSIQTLMRPYIVKQSPFLNSGMIFAVFKSSATVPEFTETW